MKHIFIIDGNSIGYAAQNSRSLKTGAGEPVQAIFNTLRTVKSIQERNPQASILILWDSPKLWRYDVYPEYKANRDTKPELVQMRAEFKVQRPQIVRGLYYLGVNQLSAKGFEADDLAGFLAPYYLRKGYTVDLISGDKDWLQLVEEGVNWIDPINNRSCEMSNFEMMTECKTARQFVDSKALIGDKSDNLDGVPRIGAKAAAAIMEEFGDVDGLFEYHAKHGDLEKDQFSPIISRARKNINALCNDESIQSVFKLNRQLMDLRNAPRPKPNELNITKGKKNNAKFREFCEERQFKSILRELHMWDATFKG